MKRQLKFLIYSGVWKGAAYQYDVDESWEITFLFDKKMQQYIIQYPSLGCSGYWHLLQYDTEIVEFR